MCSPLRHPHLCTRVFSRCRTRTFHYLPWTLLICAGSICLSSISSRADSSCWISTRFLNLRERNREREMLISTQLSRTGLRLHQRYIHTNLCVNSVNYIFNVKCGICQNKHLHRFRCTFMHILDRVHEKHVALKSKAVCFRSASRRSYTANTLNC